jgi:hypothetical protein
MKIELKELTVREVAEKYVDNKEEGVIGYNGKLNIRPKYQREFIYKDKDRDAVINTILKGFPLNVIYWVDNKDGTFEVLDGQQRIISFCKFVTDEFRMDIDGRIKSFGNLSETVQEKILNYNLNVYICDGNDQEKLDWFRIINIAGVKLTEQELRNAVYTGTWLTDAKAFFSKTNCVAHEHASSFVNGSPIRQEYLETALDWISKGKIEEYMSEHQHDPNAEELWKYFKNVIDWVQATFPKYYKEMKGINWGGLYDEFKDMKYDTAKLEKVVESLMLDDDVSNKKGIFTYILTRNEKHLNLRAFTESQKRVAFEKQQGICAKCNKKFEITDMEADHITPWSKGGKTSPENCQMLCKECNRRKSSL